MTTQKTRAHQKDFFSVFAPKNKALRQALSAFWIRKLIRSIFARLSKAVPSSTTQPERTRLCTPTRARLSAMTAQRLTEDPEMPMGCADQWTRWKPWLLKNFLVLGFTFVITFSMAWPLPGREVRVFLPLLAPPPSLPPLARIACDGDRLRRTVCTHHPPAALSPLALPLFFSFFFSSVLNRSTKRTVGNAQSRRLSNRADVLHRRHLFHLRPHAQDGGHQERPRGARRASLRQVLYGRAYTYVHTHIVHHSLYSSLHDVCS